MTLAAAPLVNSFLMWLRAAQGTAHHTTAARLVTGITERADSGRGTAALVNVTRGGWKARASSPGGPLRSQWLSSAGLQGEDRPVHTEPQRLERLPQQRLRLHPHAGGQRHPSVFGAGL